MIVYIFSFLLHSCLASMNSINKITHLLFPPIYTHKIGHYEYNCVLHAIEWTPALGDSMNVWCLQCPVLLTSCILIPKASFMDSVNLIFGLSLFLLPLIFHSIVVFSEEPWLLRMCLKWDSFSFVVCAWAMFQDLFALGPTRSAFVYPEYM